jgi:hypothetical protein
MNEILAVVAICFYILLGFSFLHLTGLLGEKTSFEKIPYSFAVGLGFISMQMFFYSLAKVPWALLNITVPWFILIILGLFKQRKNPIKNIKLNKEGYTGIGAFFGLTIVLLLVFVCFESLLRPLSAWDGWASWVLKGKIFYIDGYVNPHAYLILPDNYAYIINLAVTFLYNVIGKADDRAVMLLFYAFYFMLGLSFFNSLKKRSGKTLALIFTFLLLSTQNLVRHGGRFEAGYVDLALGFYIFLTATLMLEYLSSKRTKSLIALIVFLSITSLVKEEGMFFSFIVLLILIYKSIANKNLKHLAFSVLYLIPLLIWQGFKLIHGISFHYLYVSYAIHLERALNVFRYIIYELINIKNWNFLWVLFFIGMFNTKLKSKENIIYFVIIAQLILYACVFLISPHDPAQHIPNVMDRLLLHLAPLAVYMTALGTCRLLRN